MGTFFPFPAPTAPMVQGVVQNNGRAGGCRPDDKQTTQNSMLISIPGLMQTSHFEKMRPLFNRIIHFNIRVRQNGKGMNVK